MKYRISVRRASWAEPIELCTCCTPDECAEIIRALCRAADPDLYQILVERVPHIG